MSGPRRGFQSHDREASEALAEEQVQLRQALAEVRRRMLELGQQYARDSEARVGWFERATIVDDLVASIPIEGSRPVGLLSWRSVPRDDAQLIPR